MNRCNSIRTFVTLSLAAFALALAGCDDNVTCTRQSDCNSGYYCSELLTCLLDPPDGGDGGESDAGPDLLNGDASPSDLRADDAAADGGTDGSSADMAAEPGDLAETD